MKNLKFIMIIPFLCLAVSVYSCNKEEVSEKEKISVKKRPDKMDIYLFIGQSNMAGRAEIEIQDCDTLERVFLYKGLTDTIWEKAANPLNKYSTIRKSLSMQKLNPAYTFAIKMTELEPDNEIGLVVNAKGGTSISLWEPGSEFYKQAVLRTKAAMEFGVLNGIAWHQGESDVSKYDTYMPKIIALIEALRAEFEIPDLPFVVGQLSKDKKTRIPFNQMLIQLPSKIQNVSVVSTENTSTIDQTHFDSESQRLLGERYANEMFKLIQE